MAYKVTTEKNHVVWADKKYDVQNCTQKELKFLHDLGITYIVKVEKKKEDLTEEKTEENGNN
jgi:hypothetical protein